MLGVTVQVRQRLRPARASSFARRAETRCLAIDELVAQVALQGAARPSRRSYVSRPFSSSRRPIVRDQHRVLAEPGPLPEPRARGLGRRLGERGRRQPGVAQRDRGGQRVRQPRPADRLGPGQELPRRVVRHRAQHVRPDDVAEQQRRRAVAEVLAYRIEDIAALNAVDNDWPPAKQPERVGGPISERRVRVDMAIPVFMTSISVIDGRPDKVRPRPRAVGGRRAPGDYRALL